MMFKFLIGMVSVLLLGSFGAMMYFVIQRDWTGAFWAGGAFMACYLIGVIMWEDSEATPRYIDRWDVGREDEF